MGASNARKLARKQRFGSLRSEGVEKESSAASDVDLQLMNSEREFDREPKNSRFIVFIGIATVNTQRCWLMLLMLCSKAIYHILLPMPPSKSTLTKFIPAQYAIGSTRSPANPKGLHS